MSEDACLIRRESQPPAAGTSSRNARSTWNYAKPHIFLMNDFARLPPRQLPGLKGAVGDFSVEMHIHHTICMPLTIAIKKRCIYQQKSRTLYSINSELLRQPQAHDPKVAGPRRHLLSKRARNWSALYHFALRTFSAC